MTRKIEKLLKLGKEISNKLDDFDELFTELFSDCQGIENTESSLWDAHTNIYKMNKALEKLIKNDKQFRDKDIVRKLECIKSNIRFRDLHSLSNDIDTLIVKVKMTNNSYTGEFKDNEED